MEMTDLQTKLHTTAVQHGWWEPDREQSFGDFIALCHCELSEALQAYRDGYSDKYVTHVHGEPVGPVVELADVVIRILDWCGGNGIDLESVMLEKDEFNQNRSWRHGGKLL